MVGGCPAELTTDINSPPSLSNLGHFTILPPAQISSDRSGFTTHRVDDVPGGEEGEGLDVDRGGEEEIGGRSLWRACVVSDTPTPPSFTLAASLPGGASQ